MKTDLYHASGKLLEVGVPLHSEVRSVLGDNEWIDEEFEKFRSGRSVSRREAWFAADSEADAVKYLKAQQNYDVRRVHLYRVGMSSPQRHPMVLVDTARRNKGNAGRLREIANEYWHPTMAWRFWEYLDLSVTVIEELDLPDSTVLAGAMQRYMADRDLAGDLWPMDQRPMTKEFQI